MRIENRRRADVRIGNLVFRPGENEVSDAAWKTALENPCISGMVTEGSLVELLPPAPVLTSCETPAEGAPKKKRSRSKKKPEPEAESDEGQGE